MIETFTLPLPPSTNHAYKICSRKVGGQYRAMMVKTGELIAWEEEVAWTIRDWAPPEHTPLKVNINIYLQKNKMRRIDIDGMIKAIIDAVVGRRRDQWIDYLEVRKFEVLLNLHHCQITIEEMRK